jgi:hypothetical protein
MLPHLRDEVEEEAYRAQSTLEGIRILSKQQIEARNQQQTMINAMATPPTPNRATMTPADSRDSSRLAMSQRRALSGLVLITMSHPVAQLVTPRWTPQKRHEESR